MRCLLPAIVALATLAAGCDVPAGPRRPAFPRLDTTGLLVAATAGRGAGAVALADEGEAEDEDEEGDETEDAEGGSSLAPPDEGTPTATGPVLLPLADDVVAVMQPVAGRAWTWRRDGGMTVLAHESAGGGEDALVFAMDAPALLPGWPGVEHFVRWFLVRGAADDLVAVTRAGWASSLGLGLKAWASEWVGTAVPDLLALGLLVTEPWSAVSRLSIAPESFSGWRWTGRNEAGLLVRLAQLDATWHAAPTAGWSPTMVDGAVAALQDWARRMPAAKGPAARVARRLRLGQIARPTLHCLALAPCALDLPLAATTAQDADAEPKAALYDDRGRLVARAEAADLEVTDGALRWRWGGGRAGTYLARWHTGAAEPAFDPAGGPHAAVAVGEVRPGPAVVALGYVDAGEPRVRGRFVVAACRAPCAAAEAISSYLQQLRPPTERELTLLRAHADAVAPEGDADTGDFLAALGARLGDLAKALAADEPRGRVQLEAWWRGAVAPRGGP